MAIQTRGMFGALPAYGTPPIMGAPPQQQLPPGAGMGTPTPPSFFGEGGAGRGIAGTIGDYLLQQAHMQPVYAPAQQQNRQQALLQQRYQQQKQDEQSTWLARQEYERANPKPVNNDTISDFNFIAQKLGPEKATEFLGTIAAGPPMAVDAVDPVTHQTVRQYIPRTSLPGMGSAPSGPPPAAIDHLRSNPALGPAFDQKYGPGAAARILGAGGPVQQAPVTFP